MAMGARHVGGKAAFVNVNDGASAASWALMRVRLRALVFVRFGMGERFLCHANAPRTAPSRQPRRKTGGRGCPSSPREQNLSAVPSGHPSNPPPGTNLPKIGLKHIPGLGGSRIVNTV